MVVEHSFVTTLEPAPALEAADALLRRRGFVRSLFGQTDALEMSRGKNSASRAKTAADLPQAVRIHFDRGRVTVALSIDNNAVWGTQSSLGGTSRSSKNLQLHTDLLTSIAVALEHALAHGVPPDTASADWSRIEAEIENKARRRSRNLWITLAVIIALFVAIIVIAVVADS